jgi:alpha-L-rhamnosidase
LWASGKIRSGQSQWVPYKGKSAASGGRIWWKVRCWDQNGEISDWSEPAWWEGGLPYPQNWAAKWIGISPMLPVVNEATDKWFKYGFVGQEIRAAQGDKRYEKGSAEPADPKLWLDHLSKPAPYFRREFSLIAEPENVRAYICGLGFYELYINGQRVGDRVLDPAYQKYGDQAFYVSYDVTSYLKKGKNTIGILLGDGLFNQVGMSWFYYGQGFLRHGDPCVIMQMEGTLSGGRSIKIETDRMWRATQSGPLLRNQFYIGEVYDARRELGAWTEPGYDDARWTQAAEIAAPVPSLVPMLAPPEKKIRTIRPVKILEPMPGLYVVDFGEAFCGKTRLKVRAPSGTIIVQRLAQHIRNHPQFMAEKQTLLPDGTFNSGKYFLGGLGGLPYEAPELHGNASIPNMIMLTPVSMFGKAWFFKNTSVYVASGSEDVFENKFMYSGFRYAELIGLPKKPSLDDIEGVVVHTDSPQTGFVQTDNERLNILYGMFTRTLDYTVHATLQDNCDAEKGGWKFDLNVGDLYAYYRNNPQFWEKYIRDTQLNTVKGIPANISPTTYKSYSLGHPLHHYYDYGAHTVTAPWREYLFNADQRTLRNHFPYMREWVDVCYPYVMKREDISQRALGDWLDAWKGPGGRPGSKGYGSMNTSRDFMARAVFYYAMGLTEQSSRILGDISYADALAEKRAALKKLINQRHFQTDENPKCVDMVRGPGEMLIPRDSSERNSYGSQAANLLAVRYGLVPDGKESAVMANVVDDIQNEWDGHLSVGWLALPVICSELSKWGYADVAMQLFNNDTYPSWGFFLKNGFTTTPEGWSAGAPDTLPTTRVIQSEKNSAGVWFYDTLGGILPDKTGPGFKRFILRPILPPGVNEASVSFDSLYGEILSEWTRTGTSLMYHIAVPANTIATVDVPLLKEDAVVRESNRVLLEGRLEKQTIAPVSFQQIISLPCGRYARFSIGSGNYNFSVQ